MTDLEVIAEDFPEFNAGELPDNTDLRDEVIRLQHVIDGLTSQQSALYEFGVQLWAEIQPLLDHVKPMLDEIQGSYVYRAFISKRGKK